MIKSRIGLIGAMALSCAAIMSVSQAMAADIIVAGDPEPVSYVQVCDGAGDGFFYIPGTQTCLKISGDVRSRSTISKASSDHSTRSALGLTASTETEFGPLVSSAKYIFDMSGSTNSNSLDHATISLNGMNVGFHDSAWTRFSMGGFSGASFDGYTGNQDAHFLEYGMGVESAKILIGAETLDGNLEKINPYAGVEVSLGNVAKAFGLVVYDAENKATAGRIGASATMESLTLAGWAAFDDGNSSYVTGSGKLDYGVFATANVTEKLALVAGYSNSDDSASSAYATFGAVFNVVDNLKFTPEIKTDLEGSKNTTGRITLLRSF